MPQKSKKQAVRSAKKLEAIPTSQQLNLFGNFWVGEAGSEDFSNTIELWDALPIHAVSSRRQSKVRDTNGRLPVHSHGFQYRKRSCRIEIQPASIKTSEGYKDFYPSADEELVEQVLRKIFADQQYGRHDAEELESWVSFSLQMVRKELKKRGKTRSIDQIKRSLDILAKSHISLFVEDDTRPIYMNSVLSDVTQVTREDYLNDGTAMCWARLPALISKSVNELSYRQFNYGKLMQLDSPLARWFHRRLSHNFTNAHITQPYEILFSSVKRDSALLPHARTQENVKTLESALSELTEKGILMTWKKTERRGARNKIEHLLYTLTPSVEFVQEVKAANARTNDHEKKLQSSKPSGR